MLQTEHAIVAGQSQRGNDPFPCLLIHAVPNCPEGPRALRCAGIMLGIQNTIASYILRIHADILRMDMPDRTLERPDRLRDINALPREM